MHMYRRQSKKKKITAVIGDIQYVVRVIFLYDDKSSATIFERRDHFRKFKRTSII